MPILMSGRVSEEEHGWVRLVSKPSFIRIRLPTRKCVATMVRPQPGARYADLRIFMPVMREALFRFYENVLDGGRTRVRALRRPFP